jgi:enoyl-[acyl-carrier-protein] reductase (NADH)
MLTKLLWFINGYLIHSRRERIFWRVNNLILEAAKENVIVDCDVKFHHDFDDIMKAIAEKTKDQP